MVAYETLVKETSVDSNFPFNDMITTYMLDLDNTDIQSENSEYYYTINWAHNNETENSPFLQISDKTRSSINLVIQNLQNITGKNFIIVESDDVTNLDKCIMSFNFMTKKTFISEIGGNYQITDASSYANKVKNDVFTITPTLFKSKDNNSTTIQDYHTLGNIYLIDNKNEIEYVKYVNDFVSTIMSSFNFKGVNNFDDTKSHMWLFKESKLNYVENTNIIIDSENSENNKTGYDIVNDLTDYLDDINNGLYGTEKYWIQIAYLYKLEMILRKLDKFSVDLVDVNDYETIQSYFLDNNNIMSISQYQNLVTLLNKTNSFFYYTISLDENDQVVDFNSATEHVKEYAKQFVFGLGLLNVNNKNTSFYNSFVESVGKVSLKLVFNKVDDNDNYIYLNKSYAYILDELLKEYSSTSFVNTIIANLKLINSSFEDIEQRYLAFTKSRETYNKILFDSILGSIPATRKNGEESNMVQALQYDTFIKFQKLYAFVYKIYTNNKKLFEENASNSDAQRDMTRAKILLFYLNIEKNFYSDFVFNKDVYNDSLEYQGDIRLNAVTLKQSLRALYSILGKEANSDNSFKNTNFQIKINELTVTEKYLSNYTDDQSNTLLNLWNDYYGNLDHAYSEYTKSIASTDDKTYIIGKIKEYFLNVLSGFDGTIKENIANEVVSNLETIDKLEFLNFKSIINNVENAILSSILLPNTYYNTYNDNVISTQIELGTSANSNFGIVGSSYYQRMLLALGQILGLQQGSTSFPHSAMNIPVNVSPVSNHFMNTFGVIDVYAIQELYGENNDAKTLTSFVIQSPNNGITCYKINSDWNWNSVEVSLCSIIGDDNSNTYQRNINAELVKIPNAEQYDFYKFTLQTNKLDNNKNIIDSIITGIMLMSPNSNFKNTSFNVFSDGNNSQTSDNSIYITPLEERGNGLLNTTTLKTKNINNVDLTYNPPVELFKTNLTKMPFFVRPNENTNVDQTFTGTISNINEYSILVNDNTMEPADEASKYTNSFDLISTSTNFINNVQQYASGQQLNNTIPTNIPCDKFTEIDSSIAYAANKTLEITEEAEAQTNATLISNTTQLTNQGGTSITNWKPENINQLIFDLGIVNAEIINAKSIKVEQVTTTISELTTSYAYGTIRLRDTDWTTITYKDNAKFINPVLILGDPTYKDTQYVIPKIKNVGPSSFEARFVPASNDPVDTHKPEIIPYVVAEKGSTITIGSMKLHFNTFETSKVARNNDSTFETIDISSLAFTNTPTLLTQIQTDNNKYNNKSVCMNTRAKSIDTTQFQVALQPEELLLETLEAVQETVGYLVVTTGSDTSSNGTQVVANTFSNQNFNAAILPFPSPLPRIPITITKISSYKDSNPCNYRIINNSNIGVCGLIQEDTSKDAERVHTQDDMSYIAFA